jgi:hypothetical protein
MSNSHLQQNEEFKSKFYDNFLWNTEYVGNSNFPLGEPVAEMLIRRSYMIDFKGVFYDHPLLKTLLIMEVVLVNRLKGKSPYDNMRAATKVIISRSDVFPY